MTFLEDFGASIAKEGKEKPSPPPDPVNGREVELERVRAAGYETGYRAGWDDATDAMTEDSDRVKADFARSLEDLSFTFQEARSHVLTTLEPVFAAIFEKLVPSIAPEALASVIAAELMPLSEEAADTPIQVLVSPKSAEALSALLEDTSSVPFKLVEQDTLPEGQVYLRSGQMEKRIDLMGAVEELKAAVQSIYEVNEKVSDHG